MGAVHLAMTRSAKDVERATRFVQVIYRNSFGTMPGEVPWYATAWSEKGDLVGVLGIQLGSAGRLPMHVLYDVDGCSAIAEYDEHCSAYYSRFAATGAHVSILLMRTATFYAMQNGCRFGSAIFLSYLQKRLVQLGLGDVWKHAHHKGFNGGSVAPNDRSYFEQEGIGCYVAILAEKQEVLRPMVARVLEKVPVTWDLELAGAMTM